MKAIDLADRSPADYNRLRLHIEKLVSGLSAPDGLTRKQGLSDILERATIKPGILSIILRRHALNLAQDANTQQLGHELSVPFHTKRRGVEYKIIIGGIKSQPAILDQNLIHAIRRSHEWLRLLAEEQDWSIDRLAKHVTMDASDVTRFLPLAFLSPYIVDAIVNGKQPVDLNLERLKKIGPIPFDWEAQKRLLGFQTPSNSTPL